MVEGAEGVGVVARGTAARRRRQRCITDLLRALLLIRNIITPSGGATRLLCSPGPSPPPLPLIFACCSLRRLLMAGSENFRTL